MFAKGAVLAMAVVALLVFATQTYAADEKTHDGTVVSAADGKLVMTSDGKEHTHVIAAGTKITVDGKPGKLTDLKKGDKITVTTEGGKVTKVSKGK